MYEIKKTARLKEELKLVDGDKELIVPVDVDFNSALHRYNLARNNIIRARNGALEDTGKAVCDLFEVFFGADATVKIVEWYEGRWEEMLEDVFPYLTGVIVPKLEAASKAKRDKLVAMYKESARRRHKLW